VAGVVEKIETDVARRAAGIGVAADGFTDYFREAGISPERIHRVRNPARLGAPTKTRDEVRKQLGWKSDDFVVLHSGSMGYKQGLESVLDAAVVARDDGDLRFVLQGDGNQKAELQAQAAARGLRNVSFLPLAPVEELPNILRAADALLLSQRQSVRNMSLPSKLTTYFLAGVPTVAAVAPDDEVAREIECAGAGVVLEPGNPRRLVKVLAELQSDPRRAHDLGASARAFAEQHLAAASAIDGFDLMLRSCLVGTVSRAVD
jgi:glycosyltransferase involved in cell wall biosynthesis